MMSQYSVVSSTDRVYRQDMSLTKKHKPHTRATPNVSSSYLLKQCGHTTDCHNFWAVSCRKHLNVYTSHNLDSTTPRGGRVIMRTMKTESCNAPSHRESKGPKQNFTRIRIHYKTQFKLQTKSCIYAEKLRAIASDFS